MQPNRPNTKTARAIEDGIDLEKTAGTFFAANFLRLKGVGIPTVHRVLTRPWDRRGGGREQLMGCSA